MFQPPVYKKRLFRLITRGKNLGAFGKNVSRTLLLPQALEHETLYDLGRRPVHKLPVTDRERTGNKGRRPIHFNSVLLTGAFDKGNAALKSDGPAKFALTNNGKSRAKQIS
jgi:hypothetical protein